MKKFLSISLFAAALILSACELIFVTSDNSTPGTPSNPGVPNGTPRQFWAINARDDSFYRLSAQKLAENEYCTVWVETGNTRANASVAQTMATAYARDIYPKMKAVFSIDNLTYQGYTFRDTIALADAFGDEDDKLCILLLDIRDDFNPTTNLTFVGGYFYPGDFNPESSMTGNRHSNECDIIYVDTYPTEPGSEESNKTIAHEMQHMINLINDEAVRGVLSDTWLNEGLSSAAEWVYTRTPDTLRLNHYNTSPTIRTGNNFFIWDKYWDLDDYATVNLFFQWLRLQSGGSENIYKTISGSTRSDYNAVVGAMNDYNDWGTLLKTWLAANYINAPSGPYGYRNDSVLKNVKARTLPAGTTSINLYPGEGVYSITNNSGSTPNSGRNIRYAGLNKSSSTVNDSSVFASGALLTYNIDTNLGSRPEAGMTTGVAASVEAVPESLSVRALLSGPYQISLGEMLRRNGHGEVTLPFLRLSPRNKEN